MSDLVDCFVLGNRQLSRLIEGIFFKEAGDLVPTFQEMIVGRSCLHHQCADEAQSHFNPDTLVPEPAHLC